VLHNKTFAFHNFSAQTHYFTRLTIEKQTFWKIYQQIHPKKKVKERKTSTDIHFTAKTNLT